MLATSTKTLAGLNPTGGGRGGLNGISTNGEKREREKETTIDENGFHSEVFSVKLHPQVRPAALQRGFRSTCGAGEVMASSEKGKKRSREKGMGEEKICNRTPTGQGASCSACKQI